MLGRGVWTISSNAPDPNMMNVAIWTHVYSTQTLALMSNNIFKENMTIIV